MEPWMWVAVGLGAWSIYFGTLGWYVATVKERDPLEGVLLAVLAGPLGVLLEALFPQAPPKPSPAPVASRPPVRSRKLMGEVGE
jgi:hypothetical protein